MITDRVALDAFIQNVIKAVDVFKTSSEKTTGVVDETYKWVCFIHRTVDNLFTLTIPSKFTDGEIAYFVRNGALKLAGFPGAMIRFGN